MIIINDTIAAISTALGVGAISIIRVSGNNAIDIVNKIFKGKDLNKVATHTINYGHIYEEDKIIDEVLVSVMKKPKTFTKEDIIEINCHGGIATTNKVLELLLNNGARLAEPGEFTKRAFLNGRIDLIEAEAVMDLINSKSEYNRKLAINQLEGKTSSLIKDIRKELLKLIANIEVNIDYPEYEDIEEVKYSNLSTEIDRCRQKLGKLLNESESGKIIKEGLNVVIIGRPNVGKSSILNRLLDEDKAIVTNIAGTTRDVVEGTINLNGIILNIMDTAGIRKTENKIEKIGVEKSIKLIDKADLIIAVLNNNENLTDEDIDIIDKIKTRNHIIVINKADLKDKIDISRIDSRNIVRCNTIDINGLDELKGKIKQMFNLDKIETEDPTYLSNARQISTLKTAIQLTDDVKSAVNNKLPIDIIEIDIKKIWTSLGEIVGETFEDELLNQLFSQFCLGK